MRAKAPNHANGKNIHWNAKFRIFEILISLIKRFAKKQIDCGNLIELSPYMCNDGKNAGRCGNFFPQKLLFPKTAQNAEKRIL